MVRVCSLLIVIFVFSFLPLKTAFKIGGDESFEVIKPLLCNRNYSLYADIWNDQPPVLTMIIAATFNIFGTSMFVARLVSVVFSLILISAFWELIYRRSGLPSALFGTFLLIAAPTFMILSASAMLEVPAFAMALLSILFFSQWRKQSEWWFLLLSGVAMAIALQTKLTSALIIPALFVEFLLTCRSGWKEDWIKVSARFGGIFIAGLLAMFILIGLTWGKGSLDPSIKSHTEDKLNVPGIDRPEDHKFNSKIIAFHAECILAAAMAIVTAVCQRRLREISFPISLLITVSLVHLIHRPWWDYYYLHFAIPIAWLAGWTLATALNALLRKYPRNRAEMFSGATLQGLVLCIIVACVLARSENRLEAGIREIRSREPAEKNPILKKMSEYSPWTKLVYSESGIYPFYANLPIRPELAIIMPKRFWSGQITTHEIIENCRKNKPEMIILPRARDLSEWTDFLSSGYTLMEQDKEFDLYIAARILNK